MPKYFEQNPRFFTSLPRFESVFQDHSSVKLFKECPRKYFYRIVLGYVPYTNFNQTIFDFGKAYHKFREELELSYLAGKSSEECFGSALKAALRIKIAPASLKKWQYLDEARLMDCLQVAYDYWLKEKSQGRIKVVAVEQPVNCLLPDGSVIAGRADQIVDWNGTLWGRDFKNTSKHPKEFERHVEPNDQADRYLHIESRIHGTDIEGIIFECIYHTATVKPSISPVVTSRTDWQKKEWMEDQIHWNKLIQICRKEDRWPKIDNDFRCANCEYNIVCRAPTEESAQSKLTSNFKCNPWDFERVEQEGE